jgi:hypothetical protein
MILGNWSVRIGGFFLLLLIAVAAAAPWLGTVDPTLFDAASRRLGVPRKEVLDHAADLIRSLPARAPG